MQSIFKMEYGDKFYPNEITNFYSPTMLFVRFFSEIPSVFAVYEVELHKSKGWILENLKDEILQSISSVEISRELDEESHDSYLYVLRDKMVIYIDYHLSVFKLLYAESQSSKALEISNAVSQLQNVKDASQKAINVIIENKGFSTKRIGLKKFSLDVNLNYNDDLLPVYEKSLNIIESKTPGLILFHGTPGTGKSTLIKYILTQTSRDVLFISPRVAGNLDMPALMELLLRYEEAIIFIEDAEELLTSREASPNSVISTLLNLTDGILGSCLRILVICTFNTHLNKIDKALLRKGRLKVIYEFKHLEVSKANKLITELGFNHSVNSPTTLAEIYNLEQTNFSEQSTKKLIGFSKS